VTDRPRGAPGLLLAGLVVFVLVTVDVVVGGPLSRLDVRISDWTEARGLAGARVLDVLTAFGDRLEVGLVVGLGAAALAWRARTVEPLVRLAVLALVTAGLVSAFKIGFHRPPPGELLRRTVAPRSYPSGHTATAVVLWGLLATLATEYGGPVLLRRATRLLAVAAPLVTMAAMVLANYHWLADVLGAAGLGVFLLQAERLALRHWRDARRGSSARPGRVAVGDHPVRPGGG
jgi:membrane-associated phospholipid phosphatase